MLIDGDQETAHSTQGFNPYFHSREDILFALSNHLELDLVKYKIQEIFFYGAGCSSKEMNQTIEDGLKQFFTNATVHVDHDLCAAAYACFDAQPEIACILGTGSNSCFFDGEKLHEEVPALSYILGDEGSGSHLGKQLIVDFMYKRLPEVLEREFQQKGLTKAVLFERVYRMPNANVFIASLAEIVIRNKQLGYCQNIIEKSFQLFIDNHVKCFENHKKVEVNFVGSIASLLHEELEKVCRKNELTVGRIIRRPLDRLVSFHKNKMKNHSPLNH